MENQTRRNFIQVMTVAALASTTLKPEQAQAQTTVPGAFASDLAPRPLGFDPEALDGLSARLISSHWENNYGGSVRALNTIKQRLEAALLDDTTPAYVYNDLKREHLMRMGSVVLHEYYFDNMAAPGARDSSVDAALTRAFGSTASWEKEFKRIGAGLGGGSGWVMLGWNSHTQTLENFWMGDHTQAPVATRPLLVMDMYEHSYHMDYGAAAGQYIDAFMRNINWSSVAARMEQALG